MCSHADGQANGHGLNEARQVFSSESDRGAAINLAKNNIADFARDIHNIDGRLAEINGHVAGRRLAPTLFQSLMRERAQLVKRRIAKLEELNSAKERLRVISNSPVGSDSSKLSRTEQFEQVNINLTAILERLERLENAIHHLARQ